MMDENPSAFPTEAEVLIANAERQAIIDDLFDLYNRRVAKRRGKRPNRSDEMLGAVILRIAGTNPMREFLAARGPQ